MGFTRSLAWQARLLLAGVMLVIGFGAFASTATAEETGEGDATSLTIFVRLCLEPGCTEDLDLTEAVDGVPVSVADADTATEIGTCATGDAEPGACMVDVPAGTTSVTVTLDEAAFPEGYEATDNPASFSLADTTEYPFLLFPAGGFPDEAQPDPTEPAEDDAAPEDDATEDDGAVSQLPATGAGPGAASTGAWVSGLVALTSSLVALALVARRALGHR
jgi:hypothetical protein